MTINGAIIELVMLCEHPMMPNFFKPSIQKVIETISEAELVEPKDEPQTFDKPSKCLGCLYSDLDKAFHPCASCVDFDKYVGEISGKDEPQNERSE